MTKETEMTLFNALSILARVHTEEDYRVGFTVQSSTGLDHRCSTREYVSAWKAVRKQLGLPVDPEGLAP